MASIPTDRTVHLFLDFDGTITVEDTGDVMFQTFGSFEPIHTQLLNGEISVAEYYERSVALLQDCPPDVLQTWALQRDVDPGFRSLLDWSYDHNFNVHVVSDGFDAYIKPILARQGAGSIDLRCNRLTMIEGRWTADFPGATESCTCFCASCKRNSIINVLGENDLAIYVGDGRSDRCAAEHCDVIFAKRQLAAWCTQERIPHHPFRTLHDVQRILATKLVAGELRPRRQAVLARQRAVINE